MADNNDNKKKEKSYLDRLDGFIMDAIKLRLVKDKDETLRQSLISVLDKKQQEEEIAAIAEAYYPSFKVGKV